MPGIGELIVICVILVVTCLWIWAVVDCVSSEPSGGAKIGWLLVIVLAAPIGAPIYLIMRRRQRIAALGR